MTKDSETRTISLDIPLENLTLNRYTIRVIEGPDDGLTKSFERRQVFIGTSPECQMVLGDHTVSRIHARIEFDGKGFRIRDEGSKNGIVIEGIRVRDAYLPTQTRIVIGETVLAFSLAAETVDIPIAKNNRFGNILGRSVEMREIFAILKRVAPTDATVLIEGESGTGKELVAEALHHSSSRAVRPFVVFDCSSVPGNLLESELFGHVKGAFTGALRDRPGAMAEANGGTLFIDEIGELPMDMQPKLLRAIEKREIKPVGGDRRTKFDIRIISATNRDLEQEVANGTFREDLFYRLGVIRIQLPPLRRRPDDIPLLVDHFLAEIAVGDEPPRLSYETMDRLKNHLWPGNVRELRNFLERSVILAGAMDGASRPLDLPAPETGSKRLSGDPDEILRVSLDQPFKDEKDRLISEFETRYFTRLLKKTDGNVSRAARMAGIHRKSLEYLLKDLDVRKGNKSEY